MCFSSPVEIPHLCVATPPAASASAYPVSWSEPPPAAVRQVGREEDLRKKGEYEENLRGGRWEGIEIRRDREDKKCKREN